MVFVVSSQAESDRVYEVFLAEISISSFMQDVIDIERQRVQLCCTHRYENTQLGESEITVVQSKHHNKPNLNVWCDGLSTSGNFHICGSFFSYNQVNGFLWR